LNRAPRRAGNRQKIVESFFRSEASDALAMIRRPPGNQRMGNQTMHHTLSHLALGVLLGWAVYLSYLGFKI